MISSASQPCLLTKRLRQLAGVIAHRRQRDRVREVPAVEGRRPHHVAPELRVLAVGHPEREDDTRERRHVADEGVAARLRPRPVTTMTASKRALRERCQLALPVS